MDDYPQLRRLPLKHAVASYLLIVLAILIGTALGVFAGTWLWPR
jgi:hypothetical protein